MSSVKLKRPLAWLLTLVMILSMLPAMSLNAFAADADETRPWLTGITVNSDGTTATITKFNYQAGTSPSDITIPATVTANGKELTVTAIGASAFAGCGLTSVAFEAGSAITTIGANAFQGNLFTSITLPNTVTSLGASSFYGCSKLTSIDLSGLSLTSIPANCFYGCSALTSANLSDGLTTIESNAFYGCPLDGISIPASVTAINGNATFYGMKAGSVLDLTEHAPGSIAGAPWYAYNAVVRWAGDNNAASNDCFIFNSDTGMICGLKEDVATVDYTYFNRTTGALTIPAKISGVDVKGLADGAFGSRPATQVIKTVNFESGCSISAIPNNAFLWCIYMTEITGIPEGTTSVGDSAFRYCEALTSITLPADLQTVGDYAFDRNTSLASVTFLGSKLTSISSNGAGAFGRCNKLTNISIKGMDKDTVSNAPWGANYASVEWKNTTDPALIITDSTGDWEYMPSTGTIVKYLGATGDTVDLIVPSTLSDGATSTSITTVGVSDTHVVPSSSKLNKVTISDGVKTIGSNAFSNVMIAELDLGATLEAIGVSAFYNCGLTSLVLPETIKNIGTSTFSGNALTGQIVIPGNVTSIGVTAFTGNSGITSFLVKQYRTQESDGVYDDAAQKYLQSPTAVKNNAPFGVASAASQVYFMDDPRPIATNIAEEITRDPDDNTAAIKLSVVMNTDSYCVKKIEAASGMPAVTNQSYATTDFSTTPSTADMLGIKSTSVGGIQGGNGKYYFDITFGLSGIDTSDKTMTVEIEINPFHTVTYNDNRGSLGLTGSAPTDSGLYIGGYGVTILGDNDMAITDHVFKGWNTEADGSGTLYQPGEKMTMPTEAVTLYAMWAKNTDADYTLNANGGYFGTDTTALTRTATGTEGESLTAGTNYAEPVWPGHTFKGWAEKSTDTTYSTALPIVAGKTYYAVWDTRADITVNFDPQGGAITSGSAVQTGEFDTALTAPTATRNGYTFGGWYTAVNGGGDKLAASPKFPTASTTYYANWTAKDNTVSFVQGAHGTMTQANYTVKSGAAVNSAAGYNEAALAPTAATGYDFTGYWLCSEGGVWSTAEAGGYIISGENAAVTFTALYTEQNDAIVVFDYAGGIGSDGAGMSILHGQPGTALTVPANPTRVGYTFDKWDTTPVATFGAEGSVTTYTATWTPVSNTVTYTAENGDVSVTTSEQVTTGSSPVKAGDVTVTPTTGFTFTGSWACSEGGIYTTAQIASFVVTKTVTFTALCTENGKSTVLFDFGGGTDGTASYKVVSGTAGTDFPAGTIPTGITRTGHTLQTANDGWDRAITSTFGLAGTITTYTLQWDITSITVTFLAGSHGTMTPAVSTPSVEHGKSVTSIPAITADTGWTFTGWLCSKDNKVYTDTGVAIYPVTEAVTFTAQYADAENATVFFDYNGGKVGTATSSSAQGKTGTAITFPTPARTDGFTLSGWSPTAAGAVFGAPGTTQTYVAQWTPVSTNTVTYAANAPTSPAGTVSGMPATLTEAYDVGETVTVKAGPRCTNGYTFAGWLASGALTGTYQAGDTFAMPNGNVTLTAQWNDPSSVLIAFDANGGSMTAGSVSSAVTVGEKATVPTVSKPGYTLTGWTSSNDTHYPDLGKAATESAAAVANENVTYTAQWTPNDNTVTYAVQNGTLTGGTTETVKTDASPVNVPTVTADTGYNFDDALWLCEVEGAGTTAGSYTTAELANYIVTGNVTFTAICAENGPATVVFDYDGGTDGTAGFKVITGTAKTDVESGKIPAPTKDGFDFDAWTPATIVYGAESTITTYKATWTAKDYTVTYAWSGDLPADITDADLPVDGNTYHWHDALTPAAGPATAETSKNGVPGTWSFDGWTASAGLTADGIEADVFYTGSWTFTAAGYTVTYVFSGDVPAGAVAPTDNNSYNWHDTVTVAADASTTETTKNGVPGAWAFDGWTTTSDLTNGIKGNVVYTGAWTFTPDKINVTFDAGTDGRFTTTGDPLATQSIDAGTTVGGVPAITPNGRYTFLGWEIENGDRTRYSNAAVASMTLIADTTFTAAYQQTTTSGGGGGGGTTTYYTLSFQENGGTALTPVSATSGTVIDLGKYDTTRTGYTFEGWYADEALTQPIDSVKLTKNTVVYAKWSFNGGLNTEDHFAYVVGYSDGTVRPNANISRAETATILYRLLTAERRDAIFTSSNSFTDVSRDLWYNKAVSSMANGGYIQGYEDGTFGGNRSITRAEFVAMVVRFLGTTNGTASFNDVSTSHWAYKYIATATSAGWINGYTDGSFKPEQAITRAEAMAIINRVLDRGTDENGVMAGFKAWPDNQIGAWYYYEVIEATNAHQYEGARPSEDWTSLTTDYSYDIAKYERP